ncbi:hypothetical protein EF910_32105 [Streptomyces sp. WAC07149]|uniref:hypothetical protein n=1 Tax=Streptomyces sp. WAC07149 TaxID=2487425 RepID=UPI000F77B981|nr:hypothetical protein [Streptomyces sp. WAC07149]RST00380.1 hypothetical protein EF910_32105 [Streptomyces sp. WAC07149]
MISNKYKQLAQDAVDTEKCAKCKRPFDPADTRFDGQARSGEKPFCRGCVDICQGTEIADHWCPVDAWLTGSER